MDEINPRRVIHAMRECRKEYGQGYSLDREAMAYAQTNNLLELVQWPASFWKITQKGLNYIEANETTEEE
jgi:hypothetical protein